MNWLDDAEMIKFRYKRKENSDGGSKASVAVQKPKVEGLRELLPPKDMLLTGSLAGVRHNTLPRSRPSSSAVRQEPPEPIISPTTLTLFRVSWLWYLWWLVSKTNCKIVLFQRRERNCIKFYAILLLCMHSMHAMHSVLLVSYAQETFFFFTFKINNTYPLS